MDNQDIVQVSQLADASLEFMEGAGKLTGDALDDAINDWKQVCEDTVANMGVSSEVQYLRDTFTLDNEVLTLLCLVLLPAMDARYLNFFKTLSDKKETNPTLDTLTSLVTTDYSAKSKLLSRLEAGSPLFYWKLIVLGESEQFASRTASPGRILADYFSGTGKEPPADLLTLCTSSPLNLAVDISIQAIKSQLQIIRGGFEERQLTQAMRLAKNFYSQPLYRLNAAIVKADPDPENALRNALVYALLQKGLVYWQNGLEDLEKYPGFTALIKNWFIPKNTILFMGEMEVMDLPPTIDPYQVGTIQLAPLSRPMDKEIWQSMGEALLGKTMIDWEIINNTYTMNMQRIGQTMIRQKQGLDSDIKPTTGSLQNCYVASSPLQLAGLAYLDEARNSFADMVLGVSTKKQLDDLQSAFLGRVFLDDESASGIIAIFQGEPGTGKTMAAESLAHELKLPLYRMDYTLLENSSENFLRNLFSEAEANSAALLFDEADALFASKKDPNGPGSLVTAFLIQQIESYNSLAILTTNAKHKIDPAFFRRANTIVNFPQFTPQQRLNLFQKLIAETGVKLDSKINLPTLVSALPLSGRNISNIMGAAILSARSGDMPLTDVVISTDDLANAIKQEMQ